MKPIRKNKSIRLRRLEMYRHDLDELYALFQGNCKYVTVSDDKSEYEPPDPFAEMQARLGNRIKSLEVLGLEPTVQFRLGQKETTTNAVGPTTTQFNELRTGEASDEADALYFKLKDFLEAKQRPFFPRWPLLIPAFIAFVCSFVWIISNGLHGVSGDTLLSKEFHLLSPVLLLLLFAILLLFSTSLNDVVYLTTRPESPSFWERTKDDLIVRTLVALASTAIGGIVGYLIGRLSKL